MFLVLPILSSEFQRFALGGPNGQGLSRTVEVRSWVAEINTAGQGPRLNVAQ